MSNQYTRLPIDEAAIVACYEAGEPMYSIAARLGVAKPRVKRAIASSGCALRSCTDHLPGNTHRRGRDLPRDVLYHMYVEKSMSIADMTRETGLGNIHAQLKRAAIPLRGYMTTRTGRGDNITPQGRRAVAAAVSGPRCRWYRDGSTTAEKIYYASATWKRLSRQCKQRDRFTCQSCGRVGVYSQLRAHHIVPRATGGPDDLDNLTTLCLPCHARLHTDVSINIALIARATVNGPMVPGVRA